MELTSYYKDNFQNDSDFIRKEVKKKSIVLV